MDKTNNRNRTTPRAQWWDYANNAAYFVTICTDNRVHYFGEIQNEVMHLSPVGRLAVQFWYEIINHARHTELGAFVVMPNHIHGILIFNDNGAGPGPGRDKACLVPTIPAPSSTPARPGQNRFQNQGKNTLSSVVGSYKSAVTKHAHRLKFAFDWQDRFYDHIIRDNKSYYRIEQYIINNVKNWNTDTFYNQVHVDP